MAVSWGGGRGTRATGNVSRTEERMEPPVAVAGREKKGGLSEKNQRGLIHQQNGARKILQTTRKEGVIRTTTGPKGELHERIHGPNGSLHGLGPLGKKGNSHKLNLPRKLQNPSHLKSQQKAIDPEPLVRWNHGPREQDRTLNKPGKKQT